MLRQRRQRGEGAILPHHNSSKMESQVGWRKRRRKKGQPLWKIALVAIAAFTILAVCAFAFPGFSARIPKAVPSYLVIDCGDRSKGFVDDNYCDCTDGRDEMQTAACSDVLAGQQVFRCGDGTMIFSSRIRDSVWDCSDGSDEVAPRDVDSSKHIMGPADGRKLLSAVNFNQYW